MRLKDWITASGGRFEVARVLKIDPNTIYYWMRRKSCPSALMMAKIVKASGGEVTANEIIADCLAPEKLRRVKRCVL